MDQFFPHLLHGLGDRNLDGVWNLTLACPTCNGATSARVPALPPLETPHRRNEYLIPSHHPLRDALTAQTRPNTAARRSYLQAAFEDAKGGLIFT